MSTIISLTFDLFLTFAVLRRVRNCRVWLIDWYPPNENPGYGRVQYTVAYACKLWNHNWLYVCVIVCVLYFFLFKSVVSRSVVSSCMCFFYSFLCFIDARFFYGLCLTQIKIDWLIDWSTIINKKRTIADFRHFHVLNGISHSKSCLPAVHMSQLHR